MLICIFCFFQLGIFVDVKTFHYFTVWFRHTHSKMEATFSFDLRMSILVENWGYNSESWSDTLIKQFNNGINITWTKTNLNNRYYVALPHKISLISHSLRLGSHFGIIQLKPVSWLCSFSHSELKPNRKWYKLPNSAKHTSSRSCMGNWGVHRQRSDTRRYAPLFIHIAYLEFLLHFVTLPI